MRLKDNTNPFIHGPQHIATYLNDNGYRARSEKCWHPASIRGMVRNLTYTGVLRCGDAHSELLQELQIVPEQQFEAAQRIRENRSNRAAQESEYRVPLNIHGQSLLSGNAYFEAKKMIINQLIRRVDVYRGYQLNITFNFDLTPYIEGDDAAAC